ncbi:alanyl-tRNA editing protein [Chachezhania antarctica]|mgnify:CR=1 FL=1|uniref:alanyl-tRNA editing protein n=1 Tax=Chachezhania antarctica TaxID=2340860 RepID=UPI000EAEBD80|nr:alanyl-tRNA editing protein [Chachezhania antarctica]
MAADPYFAVDAYRRTAPAVVTAVTEDGITVDRSLFYATGGGQPGDAGKLEWDGGSCPILTAEKADGGILLIPGEGARPEVGAEVTQTLDWDRRLGHMRVHTCLHLLSVVLPLPVTGGAITAEKGRLDFVMDTPPDDKEALQHELQSLIDRDLPVSETWITEAELDANPGLVKTMSVAPPRGAGRIRLVRIGEGDTQIDLQPCGGTHVARTGEIGRIRIGKIEKKGRQNRRVYVHLDN